MLPPDFKELFASLNESGVRYLLVGGYAVGHYGYPRPTQDLDVWIALDQPNAMAIMRTLNTFGFTSADLNESDFTKPDRVIQLGFPPLAIQFLTFASGVEFEECFARRLVEEVDGVKVNLLSLPDLLKNKRASGRLQDRNDVRHLTKKKR